MEKKAANYTAEQTAKLVEAYTAAESQADRDAVVSSMATEMGKSVASIRAKLSREGVYVKKEATRKDGTPVVKKDEFATAIGNILKLSEPDVDSLAKANRKALQTIFAALAMSRPIDGNEDGEPVAELGGE